MFDKRLPIRHFCTKSDICNNFLQNFLKTWQYALTIKISCNIITLISKEKLKNRLFFSPTQTLIMFYQTVYKNKGGFMESKIWSKTLLSIYRHLEPLTKNIDKIVSSQSINSFYGREDVFSMSNKIIEMTEKKILLINIRVLVDETLLSMDKEYAKVLILRYLDGCSNEQIKEVLELPERTMFRRLDRATVLFEKILFSHFKKFPKLFEDIKKDKWLIQIYNHFLQKGSNVVINTQKECKNEYKNTFFNVLALN